jgi:hypothetical protein
MQRKKPGGESKFPCSSWRFPRRGDQEAARSKKDLSGKFIPFEREKL